MRRERRQTQPPNRQRWRGGCGTLRFRPAANFNRRCARFDILSTGAGRNRDFTTRSRKTRSRNPGDNRRGAPRRGAPAGKARVEPAARIPRSSPATVAILTRVNPAESSFICDWRTGSPDDRQNPATFPWKKLPESPGIEIELRWVLERTNRQRLGVVALMQLLLHFCDLVLLHEEEIGVDFDGMLSWS